MDKCHVLATTTAILIYWTSPYSKISILHQGHLMLKKLARITSLRGEQFIIKTHLRLLRSSSCYFMNG